MSLEKPSNNTERPSSVYESRLINPFNNASLKEGVSEEQALEAQREWNRTGDEWEARQKVYWDAYTSFSTVPPENKVEFQNLMDEAKRVADDFYNEKYLPAHSRFHNMWTFPGNPQNTTIQKDPGNLDDLRKSIDRFKN